MLNKSELKINGAYEFENINLTEKGVRVCVIPPKEIFPIGHPFLDKLNDGDALFHLNTSINEVYPTWDRVTSDNIQFHKYLGQYNWETGNIENTIPESDNKICSYLINSHISEVLDVYEHGIFRAKVTTRNNDQWVHFDAKGIFDNDIYGYTKNEFLDLMPILREIEKRFLENEDD